MKGVRSTPELSRRVFAPCGPLPGPPSPDGTETSLSSRLSNGAAVTITRGRGQRQSQVSPQKPLLRTRRQSWSKLGTPSHALALWGPRPQLALGAAALGSPWQLLLL